MLRTEKDDALVDLDGHRVFLSWVGEGWPARIREALAAAQGQDEPLILAARRMSPGARELAEQAHAGWVDESGAAEIVLPDILISRSGRIEECGKRRPRGWTRASLAVVEALLDGAPAAVAAAAETTGLSIGTRTNVLGALTAEGLLESRAGRGPRSGRRIADRSRLLEALHARP